ncbi:hypothetical protein [Haliangium sp.]|uniref:hypothetical protein n=1 Tax=Haliangium sp. TaxID=2663208 RepID=UPI003D110EAB
MNHLRPAPRPTAGRLTRAAAIPWAAAIFIVIAGAGAGCGVPKEARNGATLMAAYTNQIKAESERFAASRTTLAKARQHNMNGLEESALTTEQSNQREVFLWGFEKASVGRDRQNLYEGIVAGTTTTRTQREALRTLREEHGKKVEAAKTRVEVRSAELAKAAKALAELGNEPSFKDRMQFYLCFFETVHADIEQARQAGEAQVAVGEGVATGAGEITIPDVENPGTGDGDAGDGADPGGETPGDGDAGDDGDSSDGDARPSAC